MDLKEVTYSAVNEFIIAIKCCAIQAVRSYLEQYDHIIVNRLETQTRQPSLFFAATLIDHEQSYEIMKLLLDYGANPHFKDCCQQTILFYVCREGKERCLELLLDVGLSLEDEDIYGQTPLYYVAKENRMNIIHKLIERKVNVNHVDLIAQQTPLFYAAREGNLQMCKVLVEAGCNIAHSDSSNKMAVVYAKKYGKVEVSEYLTNEYQNLKDQKKIQLDSRQQSSNDEKGGITKIKKKREVVVGSAVVKNNYRLYRADAIGNSNEVSQFQFEDFLSNYPDLQEMLRNPDQIDMTCLQQIRSKQAWIKIAQKVLSVCWKFKGGYFFHQPVDPSKFGIDDYFDVINEPMDFGTIKKKLTFNVYNAISEFIYDMKLVFDNCVKYNGTENMIAKHAIEIKNAFEENMKQTGFMN